MMMSALPSPFTSPVETVSPPVNEGSKANKSARVSPDFPSTMRMRGPPPAPGAMIRSRTPSPFTSPRATWTPPRNESSYACTVSMSPAVAGFTIETRGIPPSSGATAIASSGMGLKPAAGIVRHSNDSSEGRNEARRERVENRSDMATSWIEAGESERYRDRWREPSLLPSSSATAKRRDKKIGKLLPIRNFPFSLSSPLTVPDGYVSGEFAVAFQT